MEGVLHKRGDVVRSWRPRYFVLQQQGATPLLVYFKGGKPAKTLSLSGGRVTLEPSGAGEAHRFAVEAGGTVYHLMASSEQEQSAWVQALRAAMGTEPSTAGGEVPRSAVQSRGAGTPTRPPSVRPRPPPASPGGGQATPPLGRRRTYMVGEGSLGASPLGTRRSASQGQDVAGPPGGLLSPGGCASGTPAGTPPSAPPSAQRKRSFLHSMADVFASHGGTAASSPAASEARSLTSDYPDMPTPGGPGAGGAGRSSAAAAADAYSANLRPLGSGRPPMRVLMERLDTLPAESLMENFERAVLYVGSHAHDFSADKLEILQGWRAIVRGAADNPTATAARAMYVLEVTRSNPGWSCWSEHDTLYVSPENMISELRRWPGVSTLEDLKECLDFSSSAWASLYCQLHGAELVLEALLVHLSAVDEGVWEAGEAVTAALQCLHTLVSGAAGMEASVACPAFIPAVCLALEPGDSATSELAVQLLAKVCLYSQAGYAAVAQTLLGEPVAPLPPPPQQQQRRRGGAAGAASTSGAGGAAAAAQGAREQQGQQLPSLPATVGRVAPAAPPPPPPPPLGSKQASAPGAAARPPPPPPPPPPGCKAAPVGIAPPPCPPPPPARKPAPPPAPPPPPPKQPSAAAPSAAAAPPPPSPPPPPPRRQTATAVPAAPPPAPPPPPRPNGDAGMDAGELSGAAPPSDAAQPLEPGAQPAGSPPASTPGSAGGPAAACPGADSTGAGQPPGQAQAQALQPSSDRAGHAAGGGGGDECSAAVLVGAIHTALHTALSTPLSSAPGRASSEEVLQEEFGGFAYLRTSPRARRDLCAVLLELMKAEGRGSEVGEGIDVDLSDHVIRLISIVCVSPEASAPATAPLRKRVVDTLLAHGLLKVMADIRGDYDNTFMRQELDMLKLHIHDVLAPPRTPEPSPTPAGQPLSAGPSPQPGGGPARPPAPPPPPGAKRGPPPPPPPPPGGKAPAPPPPPPGLRGRGGPPAPPPLPRVDPGPQPGVKMRSLFWDKLPDGRVEGTFWEKHPPAYATLEPGQLERLFQAVQRKVAGEGGEAGGPAGAARKASKALAVLDLKRATGIGIRMSRLRVPWQQLPADAAACDPAAFASADDVRAVLQCAPSEDEAKMLDSYLRAGGSPEAMADAEVLCWRLGQVPRLAARLRTLLLKFEAPQQLADARSVLEHHVLAQQELRGSATFALALQLALAAGNFLNWGSRLGAAGGFRLKSLRKLQDTRSLDGKTTLLSWLAGQLAAAQPPPAVLSQEAPHVASPKLRVSLQEVGEVLAGVEAAAGAAAAELACCGPPASVQLSVVGGGAEGSERVAVALHVDGYPEVMGGVVEGVRAQLAEAKVQLAAVKASFAQLAAFYGESSAALGSEQELWGDVQVFVEALSAEQRKAAAAAAAALAAPPQQQRATPGRAGKAATRSRLGEQTPPQAPPTGKGESDGVVSVNAVGASAGMAKKQLSFCSSGTVSTRGSAAGSILTDAD